jgi:formylglycine-generating enzyme required for sulfatase activity
MLMNRSSILLVVALLLSQCDSSGNTDPVVKEAVESREGMLEVPGGLFLYGTSEEKFIKLIRSRRIDFPGMEDWLRKIFVIPEKSLSLPTFRMDTFEVTNREYQEFIKATGYRPEKNSNYLKHWKSPTEFPGWAAAFPVVWVSQKDAEAFCSWRGKRLPTDEEWEKAARGTSGNQFPWGDTSPSRETANYLTGELEPIGNRPEDCSPYEIYDLGGNASELTSSTIEGRGGPMPIVRGGCFKAGSAEMTTFYRRTSQSPDARSEHVGFRCVAD